MMIGIVPTNFIPVVIIPGFLYAAQRKMRRRGTLRGDYPAALVFNL